MGDEAETGDESEERKVGGSRGREEGEDERESRRAGEKAEA